jgi:pimeloyl-ACP methyl ester carboxylesterase
VTGAIGVDDWWASGERRRIRLGDADREVFLRRAGSGSQLTMLHGFPSSSHDWAKIAPALGESQALLMPDFLGFGASEKPTDHRYSLLEQADLIEAVWDLEGIGSTAIVAHDYGVSVAQELLARRAEGALRVDLTGVHLLNGGLYPDLHRPQPAQLALLDPEHGPVVAEAINEEIFVASLAPTFAEDFDAGPDSAEIWRATSRDDGQRIVHRLIAYIPDRVEHAERWTGALERTDVPLAFTWGMLDPVSGSHMAERIRERLPASPFLSLDAVCHWPQLEAPERVAAALLATAG